MSLISAFLRSELFPVKGIVADCQFLRDGSKPVNLQMSGKWSETWEQAGRSEKTVDPAAAIASCH